LAPLYRREASPPPDACANIDTTAAPLRRLSFWLAVIGLLHCCRCPIMDVSVVDPWARVRARCCTAQ
jgi:hypothetical protein